MFVCLVAALSYLAPKLEGALITHPQTIWPLWPGCALWCQSCCWFREGFGQYSSPWPWHRLPCTTCRLACPFVRLPGSFQPIRSKSFSPHCVLRISSETFRSEERRVGKECRSRWSTYH